MAHDAIGRGARASASAASNGKWLVSERMTQADISVSSALTFLNGAVALAAGAERFPALRALVGRCAALPEFAATRTAWSAPASTAL